MALQINDGEFYAIDAHSHLGRRKTPLGHGVASFLGDDLVRNLDEAGLDCAVAFPLGAPYTDYSESNQIMAEEMAKHPKRIISFCRINPNFGPEATAKSLDHCLGTLKLKGIKLHPEIEFFDPNEAELMEPIYDAARRYRVPIIFHTGMSSKASPGVIAELATQHKDVPVILGQLLQRVVQNRFDLSPRLFGGLFWHGRDGVGVGHAGFALLSPRLASGLIGGHAGGGCVQPPR